MDRRTTLQWMLTASVAMPFLRTTWAADSSVTEHQQIAKGYGPDPNLMRDYRPGDLWPLTFTQEHKQTATALCDLLIPADERSPSASQVGVVDFIDEWISAPYRGQREDRDIVLSGLAWLNEESAQRFAHRFAELSATQQRSICDDICFVPKARAELVPAARFFARFRDLTAGGFYTTPEGRKDLGYVGNVAMTSFEGPPIEVLRKAGLA